MNSYKGIPAYAPGRLPVFSYLADEGVLAGVKSTKGVVLIWRAWNDGWTYHSEDFRFAGQERF